LVLGFASLFGILGLDLMQQLRRGHAAAYTEDAAANAATFTRAESTAFAGADAAAGARTDAAAGTRTVRSRSELTQRVAVLIHLHIRQGYVGRNDDTGLHGEPRIRGVDHRHGRRELPERLFWQLSFAGSQERTVTATTAATHRFILGRHFGHVGIDVHRREQRHHILGLFLNGFAGGEEQNDGNREG